MAPTCIQLSQSSLFFHPNRNMTTRRCFHGGLGVARASWMRTDPARVELSCASEHGAPPGRCVGPGLLAKIKAALPPGCHSPRAREQGWPGGLRWLSPHTAFVLAASCARPRPRRAAGLCGGPRGEGGACRRQPSRRGWRPARTQGLTPVPTGEDLASSAMEHPAGIWTRRGRADGLTMPARDPRARQALRVSLSPYGLPWSAGTPAPPLPRQALSGKQAELVWEPLTHLENSQGWNPGRTEPERPGRQGRGGRVWPSGLLAWSPLPASLHPSLSL